MQAIRKPEHRAVATWTVEIHEDWTSLQGSLNTKKGLMYHTHTWSDQKWYYLKFHKLDVA